MSVVETLRAGRNIIDRLGWRQGPYNLGGGRRCAQDALIVVSAPDNDKIDASDALLAQAIALGVRSVVTWNDAPGRTKEDVLALYDKAIAAEEAKEKVDANPT